MRTNWLKSWKRWLGFGSEVSRRQKRSRLGVLEMLEQREVPAVLTVNAVSDSVNPNAVLTFREAILVVNGTLAFGDLTGQEQAQIDTTEALGTNDTIQFSIGAGNRIIAVSAAEGALPTITKPVVIDAGVGPDFPTQRIWIDGNAFITGAIANVNGLQIEAKDCAIMHLNIARFSGSGVFINGDEVGRADRTTIYGCRIGFTDLVGATLVNFGNLGDGVYIWKSSNNEIGLDFIGNEISANGGEGVHIRGPNANNNIVQSNVIGANNLNGVRITDGATENKIGVYWNDANNSAQGFRNTIILNGEDGVHIGQDVDLIPEKNVIGGNFIGVSDAGYSFGNTGDGVYIQGKENVVGGVHEELRNIISGNGKNGVHIKDGVKNQVVENYIGLAIDGTSILDPDFNDIGNGQHGVLIVASTETEIISNVISNNGKTGITITGQDTKKSKKTKVWDNNIGGNAANTEARINLDHAIEIVRDNTNNVPTTEQNSIVANTLHYRSSKQAIYGGLHFP